MKLEDQVVSLDLAKKLKELGVKQESLFAYTARDPEPHTEWKIWTSGAVEEWVSDGRISAFTVAEMGEMLPGVIETENAGYANSYHPNKGMRNGYYVLSCGHSDPKSPIQQYEIDYADKSVPDDVLRIFTTFADTEADARAKMLIYLIENKLYQV